MGDKCKVLIIDDEQLLRQGLKHLINWEQEGYQIVGEAENGEEALHIIEEKCPDIVVTDIVMPIMNGIELSKVIKDKYPNIIIIVLSSYNKFEYVKSTFKCGIDDYVLKPTLGPKELLKTLASAKQKINKLVTKEEKEIVNHRIIFRKFMNGHNISRDEKEMLLKALGKECYLGGSFLVHDDYVAKEINKVFNDANEYDFITMSTQVETKFFFIIGFAGVKKEKLENWLKEQLEQLKDMYPKCYCALSQPFYNFDKAIAIKQELFRLVELQFFQPEVLYISNNLLNEQKVYAIFPNKDFAREARLLNFEKAKTILNEYIQNVSKELSHEPYDLKRTVQSAIYTMILEIENLDFDITELNFWKLSCFREIDDTKDVAELMGVVMNAFDKIKDFFSKETKFNQITIQKALHYIEENYDQQIQLSDVSNAVFLNYSYLSHFFNDELHISFKDYLNSIRIKAAMELLKDSSLSISKVSELVGYTDQSYFGKVFKKTNSITPSVFRSKFSKK